MKLIGENVCSHWSVPRRRSVLSHKDRDTTSDLAVGLGGGDNKLQNVRNVASMLDRPPELYTELSWRSKDISTWPNKRQSERD
jgi:hypothetical protein